MTPYARASDQGRLLPGLPQGGLESVAVVPAATGRGSSRSASRPTTRASSRHGGGHVAARPQLASPAARRGCRFVNENLGPGASGASVRLLQSELSQLHYAVPLSGVFDEATGRALIAYRKVTGMARVGLRGQRRSSTPAAGRGGLPRPLSPRRPPRRGRPDQTGAGRDRTGREGAGDLHDELRQALDARR